MFRQLHRLMILSAFGLSVLLIGCKKDTDDPDKGNPGNPFGLPQTKGDSLESAVSKVRQAAERSKDQNNLKQMMLAMHNYHDVRNGLPTAIFDKAGKPLLSWRVVILPFVEQDKLYEQFKLDEPWDSSHNKPLLSRMPSIYAVPGITKPGDTNTHYQVFVSDPKMAGPKPVFSTLGPPVGPKSVSLAMIQDGTSNTLAIGEAADAVPWTKPEDMLYDNAKPLPKLATFWNGGFNGAFFDGSVRLFSGSIAEKTMRDLITANDGNPIMLP